MSLIDALTSYCLPLDGLPEPIDSSPNPEALAIEHQTAERLHSLFMRLFSERDAGIMVALYLESMTTAEVAGLFLLTEDQIDYVRRKALKVLRTNADILVLLRSDRSYK